MLFFKIKNWRLIQKAWNVYKEKEKEYLQTKGKREKQQNENQ